MKSRLLLPLVVALIAMTTFAQAGPREKDNLKRVTVVLKYAEGHSMEGLLMPYCTHNGRVHFEKETRALTIVDEPTVVDIMLKMVKKFDVKPPQIQFSLDLVLAETTQKKHKIPDGLKPVAKQLQEVFSYNKFTIKDKAFLKVEANRKSEIKVGGDSGYIVQMVTDVIQGDRSTIRLKFHMFRYEWKESAKLKLKNTMIATTIEMKDGETAILGASKINGGGKALITIVSIKLK